MSDPQNPDIDGYVKPTAEELAAQKKRNLAIAYSLAGFVVLVAVMMFIKVRVMTS